MKGRVKQLLGISGAVIISATIAGVRTSPGASAAGDDDKLNPLDQQRLFEEVQSAQPILDAQVVREFLALDRAHQAQILEAHGIVDPGGPLSDPDVAQFIYGQFLRSQGDRAKGSLAILGSGIAAGDVVADALSDVSPDDFFADAQQDLEVAKATGLEGSAAERRGLLQNVAQVLRPIATRDDAGFAGVLVNDESATLDYLTTSDSIPDALRSSALGDLLELVRVPYSLADLRRWQGTLLASLTERFGSVPTDVHVDLDKYRGELVLRGGTDHYEALAALAREFEAVERPQVRLVRDDDLAFGEAAILIGSGGTLNACTWNFTTTQASNYRFGTAGHCYPNNPHYYPLVGALPWVSPQEVNNGDIDYQVHDVPNGHLNAAQITLNNGGDPYDINARLTYAALDVNDVSCQSGYYSGFSCGLIESVTDHQATPTNGTRVMRVGGGDIVCIPGDSGGAWFASHKAQGVTEACNGNPGDKGLFTSIKLTEDQFSVSVMTKS
jgi:hypothetical protein